MEDYKKILKFMSPNLATCSTFLILSFVFGYLFFKLEITFYSLWRTHFPRIILLFILISIATIFLCKIFELKEKLQAQKLT